MGIYEELAQRGLIAQVTDEKEIKALINRGGAKFYIGFDPTADSLHVGHYVTLALMKRLQLAGNTPIILLGGGTGLVGDPSGKSDMRKMLTREEINHNCECFKKQIARLIDLDHALVLNNADWLADLKYVEMLREVGPHFMVNNMLRAECYKLRMEKGLSFLEFNYMMMQAYDFYHLFKEYGCQLEFGGDDQWSNMLAGTELIRKKTGKDAYALTVNLLLTSEGKKMGKTEKGAIWLDAKKTSPFDFYQYWRNVDDKDVIKCLKMLTFLSLDKISVFEKDFAHKVNDAKEVLAYEMTKVVHGEDEAKKCLTMAHNLFAGKGDQMPTVKIDVGADLDIKDVLVLAKITTSKGEARRLIEQNGLKINDEKITDVNLLIKLSALKAGLKVQKGKKVFVKVLAA
ncbi:MAG: tyrosine--tRNA ligase [Bacilli bacterium]|nr:tyrosine--tRNA ligase [Bacilli bacterium]